MTSLVAGFDGILAKVRNALDSICAGAIEQRLAGLSAPQMRAANASVTALYAEGTAGDFAPGGDCQYELPGVGALYTGHWHGKRVHDALSWLIPMSTGLLATPKQIVEVGAGTGAVLWAWTLFAGYATRVGKPLPIHTWCSVEKSGEMAKQSDRLWALLCRNSPGLEKVVHRQAPIIGDWRSDGQLPLDGVVLASYLFSRHDVNSPTGTAEHFVEFLNRVRATHVGGWTKANKTAVQRAIRARLPQWRDETPQGAHAVTLQGRMFECVRVTTREFLKAGAEPDPEWDRRFNWGKAPTDSIALVLAR